MNVRGRGLVTIRGEDGDGDIGLDSNTSKIHLLLKRKELDLMLHKDPGRRRGDKGLKNHCSKEARIEPDPTSNKTKKPCLALALTALMFLALPKR